MTGSELELLQALRDWQAQGHTAALATVVHTYGSSPRPAGSMVLIRDDGAVAGSVSGGCIEQDLIARVRGGIPTLPRLLCYGGAAEENRRIGLPCGGRLELVLERAPDPRFVNALCNALHDSQPIARELDMSTGVSTVFLPTESNQFEWNGNTLIKVHRPHLRLLLIGAVDTAHVLAKMAQPLEYSVLVCDPREEYRATWNVAGTTLLDGMPDDAVQAIYPDGRAKGCPCAGSQTGLGNSTDRQQTSRFGLHHGQRQNFSWHCHGRRWAM